MERGDWSGHHRFTQLGKNKNTAVILTQSIYSYIVKKGIIKTFIFLRMSHSFTDRANAIYSYSYIDICVFGRRVIDFNTNLIVVITLKID